MLAAVAAASIVVVVLDFGLQPHLACACPRRRAAMADTMIFSTCQSVLDIVFAITSLQKTAL